MKALILLLFLTASFAGCKKVYVGPYQGTLTGYNSRMCNSPACGGMYITIKNDPSGNPPPY